MVSMAFVWGLALYVAGVVASVLVGEALSLLLGGGGGFSAAMVYVALVLATLTPFGFIATTLSLGGGPTRGEAPPS